MWQLLNSNGTLDTAQTVNVSNVTVYSNALCSGAPQPGAASMVLYDRNSNVGSFQFEPTIALYTVNWTSGAAPAGCYDIVVTLTDQSAYTTMVTLAATGGTTTLLQYNFDNVPQGAQTAGPSFAAPNVVGGIFSFDHSSNNGMFSNGCAFGDCVDPVFVSLNSSYRFSITNSTPISQGSISFEAFNNDCQTGGPPTCSTAQSFSVQYDTDPAFGNPVTIGNFTPPSPGFSNYTFPIGAVLAANTYYFRIIATGNYVVGTAQYVFDNVTISGSH
jgi:hypothetical protein